MTLRTDADPVPMAYRLLTREPPSHLDGELPKTDRDGMQRHRVTL